MSLFNQLLQHFPSLEFAGLVKKHRAEKAAKGFSCRTQLVAMLFCQLTHADLLREICNGLACCLGKLVHPGIDVAPNKSTLPYANKHRPAALYEELFYTALGRFRDEKGLGVRKQRFRFKNKLLSLDSTTISLNLEMFPWAKFRRAKGPRREIDVVLVWRLDRWGRSLVDLLVTMKELAQLGVGFVSLTEALDLTTSTGRAMAGLLSVFAEFEHEILRERIRAGITEARLQGKHLGRPVTVGKKASTFAENSLNSADGRVPVRNRTRPGVSAYVLC